MCEYRSLPIQNTLSFDPGRILPWNEATVSRLLPRVLDAGIIPVCPLPPPYLVYSPSPTHFNSDFPPLPPTEVSSPYATRALGNYQSGRPRERETDRTHDASQDLGAASVSGPQRCLLYGRQPQARRHAQQSALAPRQSAVLAQECLFGCSADHQHDRVAIRICAWHECDHAVGYEHQAPLRVAADRVATRARGAESAQEEALGRLFR